MKKLTLKNTYTALVQCTVLAVFIWLFSASCTKDVEYSVANEGQIYMAQAVENRAAITLYDIDTVQEITFGASYGGLKYPSSDIQVDFEVDESLIESYNRQNGTSYIGFPASAYSISGSSATIKAGETDSQPLKIVVSAQELMSGQPYMIPVRLTMVSAGTVDSSLSVAYFRIDSLVRRERDITSLGSLTVSNENDGGADAAEGSPKLVDGDAETKYLTQSYEPGMWFQLTYSSPRTIGAYTFTSGNDADGRDPRNWRLEGSNDGTNWTVLDERTDELFSGRNLTRRFEFESSEAYTQYRIVVESNNGDSLFQMSEWGLIEFY